MNKPERVKVDLTKRVSDEEHERIMRSNAREQARRDEKTVKSWKPRRGKA